MLFVCLIKNLCGKYSQAIKTLKHPKVPEGIEIKYSLGLFGNWDSLMIFEAENERLASEFTLQFGEIGDVCTSLAVSVDDLKWTH
jgi:uncharacterized protein with GYD domain